MKVIWVKLILLEKGKGRKGGRKEGNEEETDKNKVCW